MPQSAPYPADTAAKGWRFELDYEQIERSSTWALAGAECRPWLLMQWMTAWRQVPCGSLPNDEEVIAALIGMTPKAWAKNRKVLMRGWVEADDGRMYHATVSARVLEMLDYRKKNADRVAKFKAAKREERAGNALPEGEQHDSNDTGTGTGTGTIKDKDTHTPLAQGWELPEPWGAWAAAEFPHWTAESVKAAADQFSDHWKASGGTSADWQASWQKWCRDPLTQKAHPKPREVAQARASPAVEGGKSAEQIAREEADAAHAAKLESPEEKARIAAAIEAARQRMAQRKAA